MKINVYCSAIRPRSGGQENVQLVTGPGDHTEIESVSVSLTAKAGAFQPGGHYVLDVTEYVAPAAEAPATKPAKTAPPEPKS